MEARLRAGQDNSVGSAQSSMLSSSSRRLYMHSQRPAVQRASSSSTIELVVSYKHPTQFSPVLQPQAKSQLEQEALWGTDPILNHLFSVEHDAQVSIEDLYNRALTSRYDPRAEPGHKQQKVQQPQVSSKSCQRPKARRTTTSTQVSFSGMTNESSEMPLRRSNTADAEVATQPVPPPSIETMDGSYDHTDRRRDQRREQMNSTTRNPHLPGLLSTAKSQPAGPATTHTDVHVIAIAPSESVNDEPEHPQRPNQADPPIPTMQVVESNSGYYEVIWDDVPPEHSVSTTRRRSSATASLNATCSTAAGGLQRVNSKLTDWSGSWNAPSNTFKPTIVVFPDEHGKTHLGDTLADDDAVAHAPPNSQMTSATHSRLPSQPASAPLTRLSSQEKLAADTHSQAAVHVQDEQGWVAPLEKALNVPKIDMKSTRMLNTNRRPGQAPKYRKLSNIEEADLRFRGHRDSVTLAHARLMRPGGLFPELFARRESIVVAKKRMHARNHAASDTDHDSTLKRQDTPQIPAMSLDDSVLTSTVAKEHAMMALRSPKPRSILGPRSSESLRHVRISE